MLWRALPCLSVQAGIAISAENIGPCLKRAPDRPILQNVWGSLPLLASIITRKPDGADEGRWGILGFATQLLLFSAKHTRVSVD